MTTDQGPFVNVFRGPEHGPHACPCCGYLTLAERGSYEICPVCFWEDDGQDEHDAARVRGGPNRGLSLLDARKNFATIGASDPRDLKHVRPPRPEEHPPAGHDST
ncbi:CPCC family cysteine-rich protein [Solwaraspora sp. WMMD791]|uniref:CPCC family cysteine-rich protein n=1 Tax=Solwaraspora sp. WMMD791 TaxID=3016086 RepID=UPI002499BB50|nr:CPCC family cysteine-rich protein [Solwaraspora sp. WMMD791]WFE29842.1 CPCC family cysteine-rich protein [Solwaraspora sp. WMMD791]